MKITSRFTMAIHALAYLALFQDEEKVTSKVLAASIQANPVIIRTVLAKLKEACIIDARQGSGGSRLNRSLTAISLYEIYSLVDKVDQEGLFNFHDNPNSQCEVGRHIHTALGDKLDRVQMVMEAELNAITMADVVGDLTQAISNEG